MVTTIIDQECLSIRLDFAKILQIKKYQIHSLIYVSNKMHLYNFLKQIYHKDFTSSFVENA